MLGRKNFSRNAKKLLQSKKFGVTCAPFATPAKPSPHETAMNRSHSPLPNTFRPALQRGAASYCPRVAGKRRGDDPADPIG
jgi:hypothetical protein